MGCNCSREAVWKGIAGELPHFLLCLAFAGIGMWIPDLATENTFPANPEIPGQIVELDFTTTVDGNLSQQYASTYRYFEKDATFNAKHVGDDDVVVDGDLLLLITGPMALFWPFFGYALMWKIRSYKFWWPDALAFGYAYALAMSLAYVTSKPMKYYVSWWRPDFFYRCDLNDDDLDNLFCTRTDDNSDLRKGFESFPSGHACYLWCVSTLCILWMYSKLQYFVKQSNDFTFTIRDWSLCGWCPSGTNGSDSGVRSYDFSVWRYVTFIHVLLSFPWWIAGWISCARVVENRHFPADIVAGALLGIACGYCGFVSQFPRNHFHSYRVLRVWCPATYLTLQYGSEWKSIVGSERAQAYQDQETFLNAEEKDHNPGSDPTENDQPQPQSTVTELQTTNTKPAEEQQP